MFASRVLNLTRHRTRLAAVITMTLFAASFGGAAGRAESNDRQVVPQSAGLAGRLEGTIILTGDIPAIGPPARLPNGLVIPDESLIVDPKSRGIANVFIYLPKVPVGVVAPPLRDTQVTVRLVAARFIPHATIVRVGQTLKYENLDAVAHNVHSFPIRNNPHNWLLKPALQLDVTYEKSERLPIKVSNDFFPGLRSWCLALDHPWHAITDSEGRFTIDDLPPGRHELTVWHERVGYLNRKWMVEVDAGSTTTEVLRITDGFDANGPLPDPKAVPHYAGPFDLSQPGNGDDVVAGRRLLQLQFADRLEALDRLVQLSGEQRKRLELAGAGEIEHLLDDVRRARAQIPGIRPAADQPDAKAPVNLPELHERFGPGLVGPQSLFGKLQRSVLTPAQRERLRSPANSR
jgi:hypothetical protein